MTIAIAQQTLLTVLKALYDDREAVNIRDWVMEHITGKKKIDRLLDKQAPLSEAEQMALDRISKELADGRPVQYVLGEAWFAGMKFYVNESVLIPRPETEELIEWVIESQQSKVKSQKVLDIGTGSGCIPVSLKKKKPDLAVTGIDISVNALALAAENADTLQADVSFLPIDFLNEQVWEQLPVYDIIVSNPPYIKQSEQAGMSKHVVDHEPGIALFVPDEDALLFYRKIALFAKTHLAGDGMIFLEINEMLGKEVLDLFESNGYVATLRKDLQGKDRMVKAWFGNT